MGHSIGSLEPTKIISVEEFKRLSESSTTLFPPSEAGMIMVVKGLNRPVFDRKNEYGAISFRKKSVILVCMNKMVDLVSTPEEFKKL